VSTKCTLQTRSELTLSSICVVSLLRVLYIARMDIHDFHYTYADFGMWSIVEAQLGTINACMPVMRPLLHRLARSKVCQWLLPPSLLKGSSNFTALAAHINGQLKEPTPPMDKLYPLDTIHLVGNANVSTIDSGVDIEKAQFGRSVSLDS